MRHLTVFLSAMLTTLSAGANEPAVMPLGTLAMNRNCRVNLFDFFRSSASLVLGIVVLGWSYAEAAQRPNIVLIMADDQDHFRVRHFSMAAKNDANTGITR